MGGMFPVLSVQYYAHVRYHVILYYIILYFIKNSFIYQSLLLLIFFLTIFIYTNILKYLFIIHNLVSAFLQKKREINYIILNYFFVQSK